VTHCPPPSRYPPTSPFATPPLLLRGVVTRSVHLTFARPTSWTLLSHWPRRRRAPSVSFPPGSPIWSLNPCQFSPIFRPPFTHELFRPKDTHVKSCLSSYVLSFPSPPLSHNGATDPNSPIPRRIFPPPRLFYEPPGHSTLTMTPFLFHPLKGHPPVLAMNSPR